MGGNRGRGADARADRGHTTGADSSLRPVFNYDPMSLEFLRYLPLCPGEDIPRAALPFGLTLPHRARLGLAPAQQGTTPPAGAGNLD